MTLPQLPTLWAMQPEALAALADTLSQDAEGRAARPRQEAQEALTYTVEDGLAVIPVQGALSKHGLELWGLRLLTSMRGIAAMLTSAAADPAVRAILLDVDSPGGTVDGIEALHGAVRQAAAGKPLYAWADGLMASAAYWMACGARRIGAPATAQVGSIGVISMHREYSRALENGGVRYTVLAAGRYKAAGNPVEPLSDEMRAYLQSGIDAVYELFLSAVEQGRGVSRDKALSMADGKIFIAGEALRAGLVDRVCSREEFINDIRREMSMSLAELRAQNPDLEQELQAELEKARAEGAASARAQAADSERETLLALADVVLGPSADTLKAVVRAGVTPEQLKALRPLFAPKAASRSTAESDPARDRALEALAAAAAAPLPTAPEAVAEPAAKDDYMALVKEDMRVSGRTRGQAMAEVAREHPEAHALWLECAQKEKK